MLFCKHSKCKCSYFWTRKRGCFYPPHIHGHRHQNKWSVLLGHATETGDAARYPCNFWRLLHFFSSSLCCKFLDEFNSEIFFRKSVNICHSYRQKYRGSFLTYSVFEKKTVQRMTSVLSTVALTLQGCVCRLSVRNVLWLNGASQSKSYY